jgi:ABC-type glycerol-3-phosphate transport system permease component
MEVLYPTYAHNSSFWTTPAGMMMIMMMVIVAFGGSKYNFNYNDRQQKLYLLAFHKL